MMSRKHYISRADDPISRRQIVAEGYLPKLYGFQGRSDRMHRGKIEWYDADQLYWDGETVVDAQGREGRLAGSLLYQMREMVFNGDLGATAQRAKIDDGEISQICYIEDMMDCLKRGMTVSLPGRYYTFPEECPSVYGHANEPGQACVFCGYKPAPHGLRIGRRYLPKAYVSRV